MVGTAIITDTREDSNISNDFETSDEELSLDPLIGLATQKLL